MGKVKILHSKKHPFVLSRLWIRSVPSPDQLKWRGTITKKKSD